MDDTDVRAALIAHVETAEPSIGLDPAGVLAAGRQHHRRRVAVRAGGVALVVAAGLTGTYAVIGGSDTATPAAAQCPPRVPGQSVKETGERLKCEFGRALRTRLPSGTRFVLEPDEQNLPGGKDLGIGNRQVSYIERIQGIDGRGAVTYLVMIQPAPIAKVRKPADMCAMDPMDSMQTENPCDLRPYAGGTIRELRMHDTGDVVEIDFYRADTVVALSADARVPEGVLPLGDAIGPKPAASGLPAPSSLAGPRGTLPLSVGELAGIAATPGLNP